MSDKQLEWVPQTDSTVPQPAGRLCAAWYQAVVPDDETLLYALAHTKGEADRLRAALTMMLRDADIHAQTDKTWLSMNAAARVQARAALVPVQS